MFQDLFPALAKGATLTRTYYSLDKLGSPATHCFPKRRPKVLVTPSVTEFGRHSQLTTPWAIIKKETSNTQFKRIYNHTCTFSRLRRGRHWLFFHVRKACCYSPWRSCLGQHSRSRDEMGEVGRNRCCYCDNCSGCSHWRLITH